jgi:hypothetical protein
MPEQFKLGHYVCHEAVSEMEVGPPVPACRSWHQTAVSG